MKISKLFHWLYAILMLLPAFAIGVTCAYAIFNKNAYKSYENKYLTEKVVEISNYQQITPNNTYQFVYENNQSNNTSPIFRFSSLSFDLYEKWPNLIQQEYDGFLVYGTTNNGYLYYGDQRQALPEPLDFDFYFTASATPNFNPFTNFKIYQYQYVEPTLSEVFYNSINKVQQSPLFNWAYDSFLATPITYITGLFGMATDHIAVMLMSYWLAISVIWLVFDMVMYVPLLVHRWIDKGVLE